MQDQSDAKQFIGTDIDQALREIAAQRVVWAKISLYPQLTAYALNMLKRQKHDRHRVNLGVKWLMQSADEVQWIIEDMGESPSVRLPVLSGGEFAGSPRIYAIMAVCAIFHEGKIDQNVIKQVLSNFQIHKELYICEVEKAKKCMQWVLLDLAGKSALSLIDRMQTYEGAHRAAQRICTGKSAKDRIQYAAMAGGIAYAAQLQRSLVHGNWDRFLRFSTIASRAQHQTPMDTNRAERFEHLLRQREIKNILHSLRALEEMDDPLAYLCTHPGVNMLQGQSAYTKLDEAGKAHIRKIVASMAKKASILESQVVRTALRLCDDHDPELVSMLWAPNKLLYAALGVRYINRNRWAQRFAVFLQWMVPAALCVAYLVRALLEKAVLLEIIGGFLFGFIVLHACTREVLEKLLPWLMPIRRLARLRSVPEPMRAVVVIPALVETREQIDEHFWRLQVQAQAFEQALQFILICDFPNSGQREDKLGEELALYGAACATKLNKLNKNRFVFVTRSRTYIRQEGKWMGWEGRRGALMMFNLALLGRRDSITVHGGHLPFDIRYVLVLGSDAFLPSGEAQRLLCTMAHPLNETYAVMKPRLVTKASSLSETLLARLYAKRGMTMGHSVAHAHTMDLHGFGVYQGVGLYDVRRFVMAVRHLPHQRLLSYQFVEGALANCALVSDVQAVCPFVNRYSAYMEQVHRRIRGMWQLLPLVLGRMKDAEGNRIVLMSAHRQWIVDKILMTLVTLATTQLLAIATFSILPFWLYFAFAFLPYVCPFATCVFSMVSVLWKREQASEYIQKICRYIYRLVVDMALCPYDASIAADAAVRALYRMAVSKKKQLEWLTKQQTKRGDAYAFGGYSWHMLPALLFNLLMVLFIIINKPGYIWPILGVMVFWCLSPVAARSLDKQKKRTCAIHKAFWERIGKQTYDYFRVIMDACPDRYLPVHSISVKTGRIETYTTPTDIGMALMAVVCAKGIGIIDEEEASIRITKILDALDALPKWKGHPYRQIPLSGPVCLFSRAVTTLGSAMLALSLMVCEQALLDWGKHGLSNCAKALWQDMDFQALFCPGRNQFAQGCNGMGWHLTKNCHDLYASRARMISYIAVGCNQANAYHIGCLKRLYRKGKLFHIPLSEYGSLDACLLPALFFLVRPFTYECRMMRCAVSQQCRMARRKQRPLATAAREALYADVQTPFTGMRSFEKNIKTQGYDVTSPYAAALMAMLNECEAYDTLCEMERYGTRTNLGFYDALAIDKNGDSTPLMEYVTAHQGYILIAATNILTNGLIVNWAARSVPIAAVLPWFESCRVQELVEKT